MTEDFDLLLRNGILVDEAEAPGELAVRDGRIVAVAAPGTIEPERAHSVVELGGRYLIPGGIDAHVHFNFGLPPLLSQPYEQGSRAALLGGTTTVIDFAFRGPDGGSPVAAIEAKRHEADGQMACDYALHLIMAGPISPGDLLEMDAVVSGGVTTVKVFMNFPSLYPGDGATGALFAALARAGGIGVVHAENGDVIARRAADLIAAGKGSYRFADDSRPDWVEAEAIARALALAEPSGTPLFVLHVTSAAAAEVIRAAQAKDIPVFAETCHNYLVFSKEDVINRPDGANWGNFPPLRPPANRDALWAALRHGVVDHVSTDDFTNDLANRNAVGLGLPTPPAGHNGVETRLAVVHTEAVLRRGFSMPSFVRMVSSGIARRLGLWPRKGSLTVGADADLVVFDPDYRGTFRLTDLHTADYSIWDGYEFVGKPVVTVLHGEVVVDGDRYVGASQPGRFIPRQSVPWPPPAVSPAASPA